MRPGGRRVRSGALSPFLCARVVGVRSVDFRAPRWSSDRFVCVRAVPMHTGVRRVRLGALPWGSSGSFDCFRFIPAHPGGRRVHSGAFSCALRVVVLVRVRSVDCYAPRVSPGCFGRFPCALAVVGRCVRFIAVCPGCRRVRSHAFGLGVVRFVRSILVRPCCLRVRTGLFGKFPLALVVLRFFLVRSVHSCAPCVSSSFSSFGMSIPVGVVGFFRIRSIPSRVGFVRVRSVH